MVHFYRGELGRIMLWRQRLDVTTNWAIVASTAMITFGLGSASHTQLIFPLANYIVFLLLCIEARRYRYYDAFRARVRMLEAHFIMPVMMRETKLLQGDWKKVMAEDLLIPCFKISRTKAILRRFRRNYIWLFLIIQGAWLMKIWIHNPDAHTVQSFLDALLHGHQMHEAVFVAMLSSALLVFVALLLGSLFMKEESGEFATKAMHRKKWLK